MIDPQIMALLERKNRDSVHIGLIGASEDRRKFGWIILQDLLRKGFSVVPINPRARSIGGLDVSPSPDAAPKKLDLLNFVVPPDVSLQVVQALDPARHPRLWFQPGSFDQRVVELAQARFPHVVAGPCIMVEAR